MTARALAFLLCMQALIGCGAGAPGARAQAETACQSQCVPSGTGTPNVCPNDPCLHSLGPGDASVCPTGAPHLDANTLTPTGELRIGQPFLSAAVMGWE